MNIIQMNILMVLISPVLNQLEVYRKREGEDFTIINPSFQLNDCRLIRNAETKKDLNGLCSCPNNSYVLYAKEKEGLGCYTKKEFDSECKYKDISERYNDKNFYFDNLECPKKNIENIAIWNIKQISTMMTNGTQVQGFWQNLQELNLFNVTIAESLYNGSYSKFFFEPIRLNDSVLLGHIMKITFACGQCAIFVFRSRNNMKIRYPDDVDELVRELKGSNNTPGSNNMQLIIYTVLTIVAVLLFIILCVIIYQKRKKKDGSVEWTNDSNSDKGKLAIQINEEKLQEITNPSRLKSLRLQMFSKKVKSNDENNYDYAYAENPSMQPNSNASTYDLVSNTNQSNQTHASVYDAMNTSTNSKTTTKLSPPSAKLSVKKNEVAYAVVEPYAQNGDFQTQSQRNPSKNKMRNSQNNKIEYQETDLKRDEEYARVQNGSNDEYDHFSHLKNNVHKITNTNYARLQKISNGECKETANLPNKEGKPEYFQLEKEQDAVYDQVADPTNKSFQNAGYTGVHKKLNTDYARAERKSNTEYEQVANQPTTPHQNADYAQVQRNLDTVYDKVAAPSDFEVEIKENVEYAQVKKLMKL